MWLSVSSGPLLEAQGIRVLSYPQYCRYRSLQRRIQEGARSPEIQDRHVLALGGVKAPPTTRLMYCRDTFSHPMLESSSNFSWQFSECFTSRTGEGFDISVFFILSVWCVLVSISIRCLCPAGCPSLSLRGRPRKRRGRDGKDSPTSSQSETWIDKMKVGLQERQIKGDRYKVHVRETDCTTKLTVV